MSFRVGFSADFCDPHGKPIFPDLGLSLLDAVPTISYGFLPEYRAEYVPQQLQDLDVLISLKPRITATSLAGVSRLCAIGRCGVGYDNVDLEACTARGIAVYITPAGVVRPAPVSVPSPSGLGGDSKKSQTPSGAKRRREPALSVA